MADQRTVVVVLGMLRSHYPGEHPAIDEATVIAWHSVGLRGLPDEALLVAAEEWSTSMFPKFPSSGEFLRVVQQTARRLARNTEPQGTPSPTEVVGGVPLPTRSDLDRAFVAAIRAGVDAIKSGGGLRGYYDAHAAVLAERGVMPLERPSL